MLVHIALGIFGFSLCYFLYSLIRPKFKSWVNCWFCNSNQWVPYLQRNGFTCKKCDQYNGFDESGDYNKFMAPQRIEALNEDSTCQKGRISSALVSSNGLCEACNQMQAVIIERLNKFEAVDERRYFEEYESYKNRLNQRYPLCKRCEDFTAQKLQAVNDRYLSSKPQTPSKSSRLFSEPLPQRSSSNPKPSRTPSLFSESTSFSRSTAAFSKPTRTPSLFSEPIRTASVFEEPNEMEIDDDAPSVYSDSISRAPSLFSRPTKAPSVFSQRVRGSSSSSVFSEPIRTPSLTRRTNAPSFASGFSYRTTKSHFPTLEEIHEKPKHQHDHKNRRRKLFFSSGKITVGCDVLLFMVSFILFMALFESNQINSDVRLLDLEQYLPLNALKALYLCSHFAAMIGVICSIIFAFGIKHSKTRVNFLDLMASVSWPIFCAFCIFDGERNPDFNLIKLLISAYLFVLSSLILFVPKKRKHLKRPNTISSAFSVASTPVSQCSSRLTASRVNNLSNLSNLSNEDVPDLVDSWVRDTRQEHTVTKLHGLKI